MVALQNLALSVTVRISEGLPFEYNTIMNIIKWFKQWFTSITVVTGEHTNFGGLEQCRAEADYLINLYNDLGYEVISYTVCTSHHVNNWFKIKIKFVKK